MDQAVLPDRTSAALAHARGENITDPRPLRLTIDDLLRLDEVWREDDIDHSTELIDGRIYHTPARFMPRSRAATELYVRLREALDRMGTDLIAFGRGSIAMPPYDLPMPDATVISAIGDDLFIPRDAVRLVVEVSDSSPEFFLGEKLRVYARNRIPEYWIVDIEARMIRQMSAPQGDAYTKQDKLEFGELTAAATIAGLAVETSGL